MHWHAYQWTGSGADRADEAKRRPASPDFLTSALPPMRTGDWLLKPASRIAATFYEVREACEWLASEYRRICGELLVFERVTLDERVEYALHALPGGVDVLWGEWLRSGRFATIAMICCPNRHVPHSCPIRRTARAAAP
ncbi:hypothetical protein [Nonomuraea zeae]|uniref:Uncharacterized protein n=1 Tax=Nonomuraea zeae TaxID=1642303 RepID=A0A5S4G575_9ACTN|nr:hypothetical protein [Nonomuraea zeae]TMR27664.1 hypothetical protein ETD85_38290 [Nonomuraea zeae]